MKKINELKNVLEVLAKVQAFGPFKTVTHLGDLYAVGGFKKYHTPEAWEPAKFVALLAQTAGGEALAVTDQGTAVQLNHEQAAGVPNSAEWLAENVRNFGKLKNLQTLKEVGDWFGFEEVKQGDKLGKVYPLAYSEGSTGVNGALAVTEEGGRVKLVKVTTRRGPVFALI